jgi:hypothetical protein
VTTGLVVCTKLIGPDLINAVYPVVVELLKHPKDHVRKKAIMALHRCVRVFVCFFARYLHHFQVLTQDKPV